VLPSADGNKSNCEEASEGSDGERKIEKMRKKDGMRGREEDGNFARG